jgi:hypothetical protein
MSNLKNKTLLQLCKCNNCGHIIIDENPQVNAPFYVANINNAYSMRQILDSETNSYFWGCGKCETDSYLTDDITKEDRDNVFKD